jgi:hypothetical protein
VIVGVSRGIGHPRAYQGGAEPPFQQGIAG